MAKTRPCERCVTFQETCVIHPNFWLCERCDSKKPVVPMAAPGGEVRVKYTVAGGICIHFDFNFMTRLMDDFGAKFGYAKSAQYGEYDTLVALNTAAYDWVMSYLHPYAKSGPMVGVYGMKALIK